MLELVVPVQEGEVEAVPVPGQPLQEAQAVPDREVNVRGEAGFLHVLPRLQHELRVDVDGQHLRPNPGVLHGLSHDYRGEAAVRSRLDHDCVRAGQAAEERVIEKVPGRVPDGQPRELDGGLQIRAGRLQLGQVAIGQQRAIVVEHPSAVLEPAHSPADRVSHDGLLHRLRKESPRLLLHPLVHCSILPSPDALGPAPLSGRGRRLQRTSAPPRSPKRAMPEPRRPYPIEGSS